MGITTLANSKVTAFAYSNFIVLCGIPIAEDIETIAHEIAHNLGLMHSFKDDDDDNKKKFIFEKHKTENIMDYSNTEKSSSTAEKVSFWKWQWEYILDNND